MPPALPITTFASCVGDPIVSLEQSQFEGEGEVVLFLEVGVDDGEVVKEDGHQVGAGEVAIAVAGDSGFNKRHTVEIA